MAEHSVDIITFLVGRKQLNRGKSLLEDCDSVWNIYFLYWDDSYYQTFLHAPQLKGTTVFAHSTLLVIVDLLSYTVTKKKLGLERFPWIRTIFMFLDPN